MQSKQERLRSIYERYGDCARCAGCLTNSKVRGTGNLNADICVVGDGPGGEECNKGEPFVGEAGQLLDKILGSINIEREDVYFTNAVICRTDEQDRTPTSTEIRNCQERLFAEISTIKPKFTLIVGSCALRSIFGDSYKITKSKGEWLTTLSPPCYFYFPIMHPEWILKSVTPGEERLRKKEMWKNIQKLRDDMHAMKDINFEEQ